MRKILHNPSQKLFLAVIFGGVSWLIFIFYNSARQTWIDGLMEAWFMSKGLVIYKDFASQYFPTLYFLMVPFHNIFGFIQRPTIILAPFTSISTFLVLAFCSYKMLKGWYRFLPLIFFLIWDPVLSENHYSTTMFQNTLILIVFSLWWFWFEKPRKYTSFLIGLLLGISSTSGQIVFIFSAVVALSILYRVLREKKLIANLIFFAAGFLFPIIFIFSWLFYHGAYDAFFNWAIAYYFSGAGYPFAMGREPGNILLYLSVFSPLVFVFGAVRFLKVDFSQTYIKHIFWILMLIAFLLPFWFAIFHPNRLLTAEAILALSLGMALQKVSKVRKAVPFVRMGGVLVIFLLAVAFYVVMIPIYQRNFSYPPETRNRTITYLSDPMFEINDWVRNNTPKDAKLFATTDSFIYLETDRILANPRASTNLPVFYRPLDLMEVELEKDPPDYWIIDERNWNRFEDFGYHDAVIFLQKVLSCEPVVFKVKYVTVRKHITGQKLCF